MAIDITSAIRSFAVIAVLMQLVGCEEACSSKAAVGRYLLKSGTDVYDLQLATNESGSLSLNGAPTRITWEWANDQVFLHIENPLFYRLGAATKPRSLPSKPANNAGGYFGLVPKCEYGVTTELGIIEEDPHFLRIK